MNNNDTSDDSQEFVPDEYTMQDRSTDMIIKITIFFLCVVIGYHIFGWFVGMHNVNN